MDNLLKIRLRAFNRELKHDREYKIILGQDLFRHWSVTVTFGKYHLWGTSKTNYFNSREDAYKFIDSRLKRRLSSPKRIGCPYQMVSFDGTDEILETMDRKALYKFSWFGTPLQ